MPATLANFIERLYATGAVEVDIEPLAEADSEALHRLADVYERERLELPGEAPDFCPESAGWAALVIYHACQSLVRRDLDEAWVGEFVARPCPMEVDADTIISADLMLRFLPDLARLARGLAPGDPLLDTLRGIAAAWPFSSVGMTGLPPLAGVEPIAAHDGLRRAYADRVIAARDTSRLGETWLRELVDTALGFHRQLWPELEPLATRRAS